MPPTRRLSPYRPSTASAREHLLASSRASSCERSSKGRTAWQEIQSRIRHFAPPPHIRCPSSDPTRRATCLPRPCPKARPRQSVSVTPSPNAREPGTCPQTRLRPGAASRLASEVARSLAPSERRWKSSRCGKGRTRVSLGASSLQPAHPPRPAAGRGGSHRRAARPPPVSAATFASTLPVRTSGPRAGVVWQRLHATPPRLGHIHALGLGPGHFGVRPNHTNPV